MRQNKDFSGFLGGTFDLLGSNVVPVAVFIVALGGLNAAGLMLGYIDAADTLASVGFGFTVNPQDGIVAGLFQIVTAVLAVIASYLLLARLLESQGRLPTRETRIWAYVGLSILAILGMMVGLVLLIVPGIILLVRWTTTSGYLIERRLGVIDCFKASWDATRGYSWPIFFAALVLFIMLAVIGAVLGGITAAIGFNLVTALFSSMAETTGNAIYLAFGISTYLLLDDNAREVSDVFA